MNIRPLHETVIVRQERVKPVTAGGIMLPEISQGKTREAIVVAVGPGKRMPDGSFQWPPVDVGERVLFKKNASLDKIMLDGEELIALKNPTDILGVWR